MTALDVRARHEQPLRVVASSTSTSTKPGQTSPVKRKSTLPDNSPNKRRQTDKTSSTSPEHTDVSLPRRMQSGPRVPIPLFAAPPSARQPLTQAHVLEAYAQIQRQQAASRVGGMRNFRGSITKGRMALV